MKKVLEKLHSDVRFKQYLKENDGAYISHFFMMVENDLKGDWQIGYYNPEKNMVQPYLVRANEIIPEEAAEPFKKPGEKVEELEFDKVTVDFPTAMETAKKCSAENYKGESGTKTIVLLQNLKGIGNIWNITYVTRTFNTINIKINAIDGKVLVHEKQSLLDVRK